MEVKDIEIEEEIKGSKRDTSGGLFLYLKDRRRKKIPRFFTATLTIKNIKERRKGE